MGFSMRHIQAALAATGSTGHITAHRLNMLATWMIEHPEADDEAPGASASSSQTDVTEGIAVQAANNASSNQESSANRDRLGSGNILSV